jgi:hypothetical protein
MRHHGMGDKQEQKIPDLEVSKSGIFWVFEFFQIDTHQL